jgi:hypothetical protein
MNISDKNWIIINVIAALIFHYTFYDWRPLLVEAPISGWIAEFITYNSILSIGIIVWIFKRFKIKWWLVAHWAITILITWSNNTWDAI